MCGRFIISIDFDTLIDVLSRQFNINNFIDVDYRPRYNVAPSQKILSVIHDGKSYRAGYLKWGFAPSWAKPGDNKFTLINARAETVDTKPTYQRSFLSKRCLILSNGFYEWKRAGNKKMPMFIGMKDKRLFSMAGLYNVSRDTHGEKIGTCTIITTRPNAIMKYIHNRMPVILDKEKEKQWLDPSMKDADYLKSLLEPYPSEEMESYQVSSLVNSPKIDTIECMEPVI